MIVTAFTCARSGRDVGRELARRIVDKLSALVEQFISRAEIQHRFAPLRER